VAHPQVAAFARLADGDAKPTRSIAGQKREITRTVHEVVYNPIRDEFVIPQFYLQGIMTYRGGANGDEAPIRVIAGPHTQIANADRLSLDPVHNEIYVPLDTKVLVFPADGQGDVAPIRVLQGPNTQLGAAGVGIDPVNNLLIITGGPPRSGGSNETDRERESRTVTSPTGQILIFDRTASGNATPLRVIKGPHSQIYQSSRVAIYPPTKMFLVGVNAGGDPSPASFVGAWSENDNGDVPPHFTVGGPNLILRQVRGVTLIPKAKNVVISDKYVNAVMTFSLPELFSPVN
jgi:hypothetical protein